MKNLLFSILLCVIAGFSVSAQNIQQYGQCSQSNFTPIQCGYYQEGYQDGASDAQSNRNNDYKRYRNKLDGSKYENYYQQGYDAGYSSIKPYQKWSNEQRNGYDDGFQDGESDKRRNISRLPERYEGQYNKLYEAFYKQGYYDGYDGRTRQYDLPIGAVQPNNPNFPTNPTNPNFPNNSRGGTATGTVDWVGKVDDRVNIIIRGNEVRTEVLGGTSGQPTLQTMSGVLPRRSATLSVAKNQGRGTASVIQQPSRENKFTGIVQILDSKRGDDDYRLQISWQSNTLIQVEEPYQSGRLVWRGRVDQTANITISGSDVDTQDASGTGLSNVTNNLSGYLAHRPGSVSVKKNKGRGTVNVLQQPSAENDYVAIVQVFDTDKGASDYEIEITW